MVRAADPEISRRQPAPGRAAGDRALIAQSKHVKRAFRGDRHVLAAVGGERDWAIRDSATKIGRPQQLAGARVERKEMSLAAAAEQQIRSGREHTAFGVIDHLEIPFLIAGLWIDRTHGAVAFLFRAIRGRRATGGAAARTGRCAAGVLLSLFPRSDVGIASDSGVVVPCRYIEKPRPRTERRRIP